MAYSLHVDSVQQVVWDSLPPSLGEELSLALFQATEDPHGTTVPYGADDGVTRLLITQRFLVMFLMNDQAQRLTIIQITVL
ncbi:hypothetical protein [Kitasatospora phosalacinea]|uniref:Uncharacterized protein n=1 Tax=Kitasatospora phosalacinea TaxID=2065 RepID=A0A9W6PQR9_9ACTN|nr:hypothetical protein [Kitasatospora phosalacinea]GLW59620.1 hypothetical protein Kpho01_76300 [Kitasatospora phosalacinea]